jgi:hypothetical protein
MAAVAPTPGRCQTGSASATCVLAPYSMKVARQGGHLEEERAMATTNTDQEQTHLFEAEFDATNMLGSNVDELERAAMARYRNLQALWETVRQAARYADALARLDASLARQAG